MKLKLSNMVHAEAQVAFSLCPKNCQILHDSSQGPWATMYNLSLSLQGEVQNGKKF